MPKNARRGQHGARRRLAARSEARDRRGDRRCRGCRRCSRSRS
jgi:hypothetical protein